MSGLNFPAYEFSIRHEGDHAYIFDPVRKRYVALTPEEWVRQHVLRFLLEEKGFPAGLTSVESSIMVYNTRKRYDIAVFSREGKPLLVVECKSTDIRLNDSVVDQITRYNIELKAPYLFITNGLLHIFLENTPEGYRQIQDLPHYNEV